MEKNKSFYHTSDYGILHPGSSIHVQHSVSFASDMAAPFIQPLVLQEKKELEKQRKASAEKEQEIKTAIEKLAKDWEKQASQTLLLVRTIEYLDTKEVKHTSNQWKQDKEGTWEISNQVYKMWFKISDIPEKGEVALKWSIMYNYPDQPASKHYTYNRYGNPWGADIYIVKPEKRSYATVAAAQKFIQARFDENSLLFSELSPPIPIERREMFSVNGYLLPGYTIAAPERAEPDLKAVDALLDYLEDGDGEAAPLSTPPPVPAGKSPPSLQKPSAHPPGGRLKRPLPKAKPKRKNTMTR